MSQSSSNSPSGESSPSALHALLHQVLDGAMRKDKPAVLAAFAPDGLFIDPHYPNPEMRGRKEISEGLDWGFTGMERMQFTVIGSFLSEDGNSGAVETDCAHILAGGRVLAFPQVFVAEMHDGLLTRVRAYEPYGPGRMIMTMIKLQNWWLHKRPGRTAPKRG